MKTKIYFKGEFEGYGVVISWDKSRDDKKYQNFSFNRVPTKLEYGYSTRKLSYNQIAGGQYSTKEITRYLVTGTFGSWITHKTELMDEFEKVVKICVDEFIKDVNNEYSLDGMIGRIFIQPFEKFFDWLKK